MIKRTFLLLLTVVICLASGCNTQSDVLHLKVSDDTFTCALNDEAPVELDCEPIYYLSTTYYPADKLFMSLGYVMGWDSDEGALLVQTKHKDKTISAYVFMDGRIVIDGDECTTKHKPIVYHNDIYVSGECVEAVIDARVEFVGNSTEVAMDKRDTLEHTTVGDTYRVDGDYNKYGAVYVLSDNRAIELIGISDGVAEDYAGIVNSIAQSVPNCKTFNMVVPTASEYYAPKNICTNQVNGIRKIYEGLDATVMPINVVDALYAHADEKIYFGTDHHWTQRGAYYAYEAYAQNRGYTVTPIADFETINYDGMVGSMAGFMEGTPGADIVKATPDLLERFMPRYKASGKSYYDMAMEKEISSFNVVNTDATGYSSAFIAGDNPLAVITTDNPSGKSLVVIKESFGNAFSVWACENYSTIYVVDPRAFNGFDGNDEPFKINEFWDKTHFDDLMIINYPGAIATDSYRESLRLMAK